MTIGITIPFLRGEPEIRGIHSFIEVFHGRQLQLPAAQNPGANHEEQHQASFGNRVHGQIVSILPADSPVFGLWGSGKSRGKIFPAHMKSPPHSGVQLARISLYSAELRHCRPILSPVALRFI